MRSQIVFYFGLWDAINKKTIALNQWSQTRGLRAACSPPDAFVRPANISKTDKIKTFDQI
jgi:hypothetical protein